MPIFVRGTNRYGPGYSTGRKISNLRRDCMRRKISRQCAPSLPRAAATDGHAGDEDAIVIAILS